jgi:leukotriene-A4 hydrolase
MIDPSSLANLSEVITKHIHLDWNISFDEKKISGHILLDMLTLVPNVKQVVLDTSYLDLKSVEVNGKSVEVRIAHQRVFFIFIIIIIIY